jgi:predicted  nucleic acid-binding Zn-ribbon protein
MFIIILILLLLSIGLYFLNNYFFKKKEGLDNSEQVQVDKNTANLETLQDDMKDLVELKQEVQTLKNRVKKSQQTLKNLNEQLDDDEKKHEQNVKNAHNGNFQNAHNANFSNQITESDCN